MAVYPWDVAFPGAEYLDGDGDDGWRLAYRPEVVYGDGLHVQMIGPRHPAGGRPLGVFLWIPGSGWKKQDRFAGLPNLVPFARAGYLVVSMEYHEGDPSHRFPAQIEEAKACIAFLRARHEEFRLDPSRIALGGGSSGGHTALMAGFDPAQRIRCIVDLYAPVELEKRDEVWPADCPPRSWFWKEGGGGTYLFDAGAKEDKELMAAASPLSLIREGEPLPPVLIVQGDHDRQVHPLHSRLLWDRLRETGHRADMVVVRGGGHGDHILTGALQERVTAFLRKWL